MVVKVYVSGTSGNKEVKKRQQRVLMILDSKSVQYDVIDIAEPGMDTQKEFMQINSKANGGTVSDPNPRHPLPPQVFNEQEYCGDYEQFDLANELDTLEQFLKVEAPKSEEENISKQNGETSAIEESNEGISTKAVKESDGTKEDSGVVDEIKSNGKEDNESKEVSESAQEKETDEESEKKKENTNEPEELVDEVVTTDDKVDEKESRKSESRESSKVKEVKSKSVSRESSKEKDANMKSELRESSKEKDAKSKSESRESSKEKDAKSKSESRESSKEKDAKNKSESRDSSQEKDAKSKSESRESSKEKETISNGVVTSGDTENLEILVKPQTEPETKKDLTPSEALLDSEKRATD